MATTAPITPEVDASAGRRVALLADAPLGDPALDRFGFAEFANALALIVDDEETATPLTIAVSAPWGGGKSSLGCMLQTMLEQRVRNRGGDDPRLVVWFNAWEHDDAPHLGAALAASVVRAADRNRHWWRRLLSPLPSAMLQPGERSRQTVAIALVSALAGLLVALLAPGEWTASIFGGEERAASGAGVLGVGLLRVLHRAPAVHQRPRGGALPRRPAVGGGARHDDRGQAPVRPPDPARDPQGQAGDHRRRPRALRQRPCARRVPGREPAARPARRRDHPARGHGADRALGRSPLRGVDALRHPRRSRGDRAAVPGQDRPARDRAPAARAGRHAPRDPRVRAVAAPREARPGPRADRGPAASSAWWSGSAGGRSWRGSPA